MIRLATACGPWLTSLAALAGSIGANPAARVDPPSQPQPPANQAAASRPAWETVETFDSPDAAARWNPMTGTWSFQHGGAFQTDPAFDHGAVLSRRREDRPAPAVAEPAAGVRPDGPFWLSVRFKPESGFLGGGLYFALPDPARRNGGMMIRCDPEVILWGRMNSDGVFDFLANVAVPELSNEEQELAVAVDPQRLAMNVFHNGRKVAANVSIPRAAGFVGIQSSGGAHRFTRFELRPARHDELAGITAPTPYGRIVDLIGDDRRLIALKSGPDALAAFGPAGNVLQTVPIAALGVPADAEFAPVALCSSGDQDAGAAGVIVLAENGSTIYRFAPDLKPLDRLVLDPALRGVGICAAPDGRLFIADAARPGIRVFDRHGKPLLAYGRKGSFNPWDAPTPERAELFSEPAAICLHPDGRLLVTDTGNLTFVAYRYDQKSNELRFDGYGPWIARPRDVGVTADGEILITGSLDYYNPYAALRVLGPNGLARRTFCAYAADMLSVGAVCAGPGGRIYLTDPQKQRIVVLPQRFEEAAPQFTWSAEHGVSARLKRAAGGDDLLTSSGPVHNAPVGQRVDLRFPAPAIDAWPPSSADQNRTYNLPLAPPTGKLYVIDFPIVVAAFCKARLEGKDEISLEAASLGDRLEREHRAVREFYFRNSHCVLNLQLEHMLIDEVTAEVSGGWILPADGRRLVNEVRTRHGRKPLREEDSLVTIFPLKGWDKNANDDPGMVGGGGLTVFGYSSYGLWNKGIAWLLCHEWNHQLDAYFDRSGVPEFWLNHPDGSFHLGRYGQHWDCNAFLMRRLDRLNWLRLRFGSLRAVDDNDRDGLPDDDPTLPFDEKRLGCDSQKPDSDGDGLTDYAEATCGSFGGSDPTKPDSDGDGAPDAQDPNPRHDTTHKLKNSTIDKKRQTGGIKYVTIGRIRRDWLTANVSASHQRRERLFVGVTFDKKIDRVFADVDADNNGWFIGHDNVAASVTLDWKKYEQVGIAAVAEQRNCEATSNAVPGGYALLMEIELPKTADPAAQRPSVGLTVRLEMGEHHHAFVVDPWEAQSLNLE